MARPEWTILSTLCAKCEERGTHSVLWMPEFTIDPEGSLVTLGVCMVCGNVCPEIRWEIDSLVEIQMENAAVESDEEESE